MTIWEIKNEVIKRCWAVNNASGTLSDKERNLDWKKRFKVIKEHKQDFYDMHSDWDIELLTSQSKESYSEMKRREDYANEKATQDGQDEKDKTRMGEGV
jgi:hypothetical protein